MAGRINRADGPFNAYINSTSTYLGQVTGGATNYARLGVTDAEYNMWIALRNTWNTDYGVYSNVATRTKPVTVSKNDAKLAFIIFAQPVLDKIAVSANITNADYSAFNIKNRDTEPTPRPAIATFPYPELVPLGGGKIKMVVRVQSDSSRSSMEPNADSIEVAFTVGNTPPESEEQAASHLSYKKAIRVFEFGQNNSGKRIYAFFRWRNESNESKSGPWCNMVQCVIA